MRLRIRELCVRRGISMRMLGRMIGMKISVLSRINTGKMCPTIATMDRVASALQADYNSLIEKSAKAEYEMRIFETFADAKSANPRISALEHVQLADEKSREILQRQGKLNKKGMRIRKCF